MTFFLSTAVVLLIFLNGATDASNAIASAVSSRALTMRQAALLSAALNVAGGALSGVLFTRVGESVAGTADFGSFGEAGALSCLLSAVIFTALAWVFRLPTSESHALLSALAGVSAATGGGGIWSAIAPLAVWMTVCTAGGFAAGLVVARFFRRKSSAVRVRRMQIVSAALFSFFHGAQDLPKFLALLMAAGTVSVRPPFSVWAASALVMGIGTLLGGRRMTEAVGCDLASLTPKGALASDLAAAGTLCVLSIAGVPASTTHAKTAAVAGTSLLSPGCRLYRRQFFRFLIAWLFTFPVCAALGFGCVRVLACFF